MTLSGYLGYAATGDGNATVTGAGSLWNHTSYLVVGCAAWANWRSATALRSSTPRPTCGRSYHVAAAAPRSPGPARCGTMAIYSSATAAWASSTVSNGGRVNNTFGYLGSLTG